MWRVFKYMGNGNEAAFDKRETAATGSGWFEKENKNALLCFGLFAGRDRSGGARVRGRGGGVGGNREDPVLRLHRAVPRLLDHTHVATRLALVIKKLDPALAGWPVQGPSHSLRISLKLKTCPA
jgi:hypothetical protein